jgi:hypothetical protein
MTLSIRVCSGLFTKIPGCIPVSLLGEIGIDMQDVNLVYGQSQHLIENVGIPLLWLLVIKDMHKTSLPEDFNWQRVVVGI